MALPEKLMTDLSDLCPHCVIGDLIEANIPQGTYKDAALIRALLELALDTINSAPSEDQKRLGKEATSQLIGALIEIEKHTYKTGDESRSVH